MTKKTIKKILIIICSIVLLILISIPVMMWLAFGPIDSSGTIRITEKTSLDYDETYNGDFAGEFYDITFKANDSIIGRHIFHYMDWNKNILIDSIDDRTFIVIADSSLNRNRAYGHYILSFESNYSNPKDSSFENTDKVDHRHLMTKMIQQSELSINHSNSISEQDSSLKQYYSFDTLTIKQYLSDNDNFIKLTGSKSGDPYSISIESKNGFKRTYRYAEHWYTASHSRILWDNSGFVLITYGCGTACYNGIAIPINNDDPPIEFDNLIYADSVKSIIISTNLNSVTGTNLLTGKSKTIEIDLCNELSLFESIDLIDMDDKGTTVFIYNTRNCKDEGKDFFYFDEIIN